MTYGVALALASTLVMMAAGYAMRFDFFTNTAFGALFLLFFLFSVSMLALAVLLSALISTAKTAQTVGYSIILLGFVIQFILTSAYAGLIDLLYSDSLASWVYTVRRILQLYPPFNFSLFFYDISSLASSTIDFSAGKLVAGPGFYWSDMYESRQRSFAGFNCQLPPPVQSLLLQLMDTAIFIALALYLDAVLPGPHGSPAHLLFFLGCKYRPHKVAPAPAGRTVAEIAGHGQSRAATAAHAGRAARADENPALAALRAGATDAGVAEETRRAESVPTMSLPSLQRLAGGRLQGHERRPESAASKAAVVAGPAAGSDAEATVADLLPILRVSHLRVVYRRGWSAALYALTGIDASAWVKPPAAQGAASYSSFPCCCRRRAAVSDYAGVLADEGEGAAAAAAATPAGDNSTRSGDVLAVNDLSFSVRRGEIFALLGHNGCGKSSTISSLTGLFNAAGGEAEILGFDTTAQLDMVQRCMGVCPQHDILWPNLTAEETLRVFAAIKGVPGPAVDAEVERVLLTVRLASVRQRLVGGFSGGMKRRLSVAIAAMGAPSCIFLDEPSTGMVRAVSCSWDLSCKGPIPTAQCAASLIHATACIRCTLLCSRLLMISIFPPLAAVLCTAHLAGPREPQQGVAPHPAPEAQRRSSAHDTQHGGGEPARHDRGRHGARPPGGGGHAPAPQDHVRVRIPHQHGAARQRGRDVPRRAGRHSSTRALRVRRAAGRRERGGWHLIQRGGSDAPRAGLGGAQRCGDVGRACRRLHGHYCEKRRCACCGPLSKRRGDAAW
jgi:ABC-type lipoprotein export system ATPase subunit